jgi:zinc transport system substrate-binding protein
MYGAAATRIAALIAACTLGFAGCGSTGSDSAASDNLEVVAAFYPLAYVAKRVAGDQADVVNLTTPGIEPHDLEPSPRDVAAIAGADLVIVEKGFQPAIDQTTEQNAEGAVLDAADIVNLVPFGEAASDQHEGTPAEDDHDSHDRGDLDPHFWQDPARMALLADAIAKELGAADPERQGDYAANAASFGSELDALDAAYETGLAGCARDTIVVSHDAFGYLAKYDLVIEPIAGLSPDAEPTPGGLANLRDLIENEGVTTVFSETLVSPELAETLAREAGVNTAVLDPIEGLSDDSEGEDYLSIMRSNLAALRQANGC